MCVCVCARKVLWTPAGALNRVQPPTPFLSSHKEEKKSSPSQKQRTGRHSLCLLLFSHFLLFSTVCNSLFWSLFYIKRADDKVGEIV